MSSVFESPESGDDDLLGGEGGDPNLPKVPTLRDVRLPDDFEDEELRGLDGEGLLRMYKTVKDMGTKAMTALEQANAAASNAASAAAHSAANAGAGNRSAPAAEESFALTAEDLLGQDVGAVNQKLERLVAARIVPILSETYRNQSESALEIARANAARVPYWKDLEGDIMALAAKTPLVRTAQLQTWYALYDHVAQARQGEIIEKEIAKRDSARAANDPISIERGRGGRAVNTATELTPEQAAAAKALGVDPKEAAKYL